MFRRSALAFLPLSFLLAACGSAATPASSSLSSVPGEVIAHGIVRQIQVKLYDLGTHALVSPTGDLLYVLASTSVNLGEHVGEEVEVKGTTMPLAGGSDLLLSVSSLTVLNAGATGGDAVDAAKRLARDYSPPYTFLPSDKAEIVSSSELSGITVVRIHQSLGAYLVKLVRKPDPITGAWSIFSIEPEVPGVSGLPSESSLPTASSAPSEISSLPSSPSSLPSAPPSSQPAQPTVKGDNATVNALVANLASYLAGTAFQGNFSVTRVSVTGKSQAYIEFSDGATSPQRGMILVSWTTDPAQAKVLATFVPGEVSDWKKASGDNVARDEELTIYAPKAGTWTAQGTTLKGYSLYTNSTLKLSVQYPSQWYFGKLAPVGAATSRIGFSNKPVAPETALVTLDILPGSLDTAVANYSGVAPTMINGISGFSGTTSGGAEIILLPRDASSVYVLTAAAGSGSTARVMAQSLSTAK